MLAASGHLRVNGRRIEAASHAAALDALGDASFDARREVVIEKAIGKKEPAGKKLDFLSQEMLREVNTMGSKSRSAALRTLVVELKTEVERIREQVQNVE